MKEYWDLIKPLFSRIRTSKGREEYLTAIAKEPRSLVLLFAAHLCGAEVLNGGFLQLFYNDTGIVVPEAIEGFRAIGMPELADLVEEAIKPLGSPYPRSREERQEALLRATNKSLGEVAQIAKSTPHPFIGFREVTKELDFDESSRSFWQLHKTENGGFVQAADRYSEMIAS